MDFTPEYFREEWHRFREVICSTKFTIAQKDRALDGLATVYFGVRTNDPAVEKKIQNMFMVAADEWSRRRLHEAIRETKGERS